MTSSAGLSFLVGDDHAGGLLLPDGGADTAIYAGVSGAGAVYRAGTGTGAAHRTIYVVRRKKMKNPFSKRTLPSRKRFSALIWIASHRGL